MKRVTAIFFVLLFPLFAQGAIFTVNDAGDATDASPGNGTCATAGAVCTLRAALEEANALAGTDTVNFGIGSGTQTIVVTGDPLPIESSVLIDGTTQLGTGAGPFILIDGQNVGAVGFDFGLIPSLNVTIQGLAIGRFTVAGIRTWQSGTTVTIRDCHIGVGPDGVTDLGNGDGILAHIEGFSGSSLILGDASGGGNVISGNQDLGIEIEDGAGGAKLTLLQLQGNIIGLAADGMTALPNIGGGIRTDLQFATVTIGGSIAARNIISGNGGNGYAPSGFFQADVMNVSHNYIGLAQDGITPRGNNGTGAVLVARTTTVESNIVGANTGAGLYLNTGDQPSVIQRNRIGVALDGSPAGNGGSGLRLGSLTQLTVGGAGNENIIAHNGNSGIAVINSAQTEIAENSIYANGGLGIDLNEDGVSANDVGDADGNANQTQNYPSLSSATRAGGITFVNGTLSSAATSSYTIRFYASSTPDPTGFGEGETYVGATSVVTNSSGIAAFTFPGVAPAGSYITATATNSTSRTSEFSNAIVVGEPQQFRFSTASLAATEGDAIAIVVERINGSSGTATVALATSFGSAGAADLTPVNTMLTFAPGETTKTTLLSTTQDSVDESLETFSLSLSNATGGEIGSPSTLAVTLGDDDPPPTIAIVDASAVEGNAGTTPLLFAVMISTSSERPITIGFATSNATANAGSDYTAVSGTLTFAPGEILQFMTVPVIGDTAIEPDETLTVTLSNATNVVIVDGSATGAIVNDEPTPAITIADIAIIEGDSGASTALFTATLSGATTASVTVDWSTSDGTATAGDDYVAANGILTFAPGETTATISVTVNGDALIENNETFFVDLSGPANASLGDAQGSATIADDDGTPALSVNDPSIVEGATATFTVTLAPASALPVSVDYATSGITAIDGSDFTGAAATLTFAAGETSKTIDIATTADAIFESTEQFGLTLSAPAGATIGDGSGTATIVDDDGVPRVTIGNASLAEGNAGSSTMTFTVDLSHASAAAIDVTWSTAAATATAGSDYSSGGGTLTFAPGEISKTITIDVLGDAVIEADETFRVQLTGATNATVTDAEGVGTIQNDDGGAEVSISNVSVAEGTGGATTFTFAVQLNASSAESVTVQWASADGSAIAGSDYTAGSGSLIFAAGDLTRTIAITVNADATFEPNETFVINLIGVTGATISVGQATGTIVNDDPAPAIPAASIAAASVSEGNAGTVPMTFTVTLDAPTVNSVTIDYATAGTTATSGSDYVLTSGTLTFAPGVTSQDIVVPIVGDLLVEGNETFTLTLSGAVNATLAVAATTGTIVDDDTDPAIPSISIGDVTLLEGDAGATLFAFPLTLSIAAPVPVTVGWNTAGGSALAGEDFAAAGGVVAFAPGMTGQTIFIAVNGDEEFEPDESFSLQLSSPVAAVLADATGLGTIRNDDSRTAPTPRLTAAAVSSEEGDDGTRELLVTLSLSSRASGGASVRWMTRGDTAHGGADFVEASGRATFGSGTTTATIVLSIVGDRTDEEDESFVLELFDGENLTLRDERVAVTILDDDEPLQPRAIVMVAGSLQGAAGSRFGTSIELVNPADVPAAGTLVVHPAATSDRASDTAIPYALAPRELRAFGDLLADNGLAGLATLDVIPSAGALPRMTVRIYDDGSGHGTSGFTLPVVLAHDALIAGDSAVLTAPADPILMRFNIGVRTLEEGAAMTIELRDRSGATRASVARELAPNWFVQMPAAEFAGLAPESGDYLAIEITRGSAILYGAAVDNTTNDPSVQVVFRNAQ